MEKEKKPSFIESWLKDKYNLLAIAILVLALLVRIYFFTVTNGQPLWWDEAEYLLKAKNIALGTPETGFWYGRPIVFSVLLSLFYLVGMGEPMIRFTILIISTLAVFLVYLLGKQLFNKKTALIASFLFSMVYVNLFYTFRIMTDVIHVFLGLLAFYLFFTRKSKLIWLVFPLLALATLIRFPSFFLFVILAIYILTTEGLSAFKKKDYWISGAIAIVVALPYLIWSQIRFGSPLYAIKVAGEGSVTGLSLSYGISNTLQYIKTFPSYFHSIGLILLIIGFILTLEVFIGFDRVIKNKNKKLARKYLLLIWLIIPLIYFGFAVSHYEDRYIFMAFPAIFYMIGLAFVSAEKFLEKYNKKFFSIILILLVLIAGVQLLVHSDGIIKARTDSYGPIKDTGIWLNEHTVPGDKIMSKSVPHLTYYSEREVYTIYNEESDFYSNLSEVRPKYVVISLFENHPDWAFTLNYTNYNLEPVKTFPAGDQPSVVIYENKNL